jgi:hypothetical protein
MTQATPATILERAYASGASVDTLAKLLEIQQAWERDQARKAFVAAMAEFKKNPPEILRKKLVDFETQKGRTTYFHEELGDICEEIVKGLAEVGVSHRWKPHRQDGQIGVSCVLTHSMGHEQDDGPLWASADTSGGKNSIQAMASSTKYLERYTLLMATGLAPKSMPDDDGRGHADPQPDWVDEYLEAVDAAETIEALVATWKTAAAACRRKKSKPAYDEIKDRVTQRCVQLEITPEAWAAAAGQQVVAA